MIMTPEEFMLYMQENEALHVAARTWGPPEAEGPGVRAQGHGSRRRVHGSERCAAPGRLLMSATFATEALRTFIERVEKLEEEKAALAADIREVYSEAKGSGFDTKIMRQVVRLRKLDRATFQEQRAVLDLYENALGMK
jgi:uncharacterized protein (UPF0335 family)